MKILIAPNAFKNSINAALAAECLSEGLKKSRLNCTLQSFPIGDGGDGTGTLILERWKGIRISTEVRDPLGRLIQSEMGFIDEGMTAIIEMANASGLRLLAKDELNPSVTSSYGTGEQILVALDKGVNKIILGMGGTATVDGGVGILKALGVKFLNEEGQEIDNLPLGLKDLYSVDLSMMDERILQCELIILCDVDNPLLGKNGAARIFGPQKGAGEEMVMQLEVALERYAGVILAQFGRKISKIPYAGVAGGASIGLHVFLGAKLVNGIDYYLQVTDFRSSTSGAELVITGEGKLDEQTLLGKGPMGIAKIAKEYNIPVIGLAGSVPMVVNQELNELFTAMFAIGNGPTCLNEAIQSTAENLRRTAQQIGNLIAFMQ